MRVIRRKILINQLDEKWKGGGGVIEREMPV